MLHIVLNWNPILPSAQKIHDFQEALPEALASVFKSIESQSPDPVLVQPIHRLSEGTGLPEIYISLTTLETPKRIDNFTEILAALSRKAGEVARSTGLDPEVVKIGISLELVKGGYQEIE